MNWTHLALAILAWKLLDVKTAKQPPKVDFSEFLSDDVKSLLRCAEKLSQGSPEEKTAAMLQIISNQTLLELAQKIFAKDATPRTDKTAQESSEEFFRQIDKIADAEVKKKLYWFYENWYVG